MHPPQGLKVQCSINKYLLNLLPIWSIHSMYSTNNLDQKKGLSPMIFSPDYLNNSFNSGSQSLWKLSYDEL